MNDPSSRIMLCLPPYLSHKLSQFNLEKQWGEKELIPATTSVEFTETRHPSLLERNTPQHQNDPSFIVLTKISPFCKMLV